MSGARYGELRELWDWYKSYQVISFQTKFILYQYFGKRVIGDELFCRFWKMVYKRRVDYKFVEDNTIAPITF